MISFLFIVCVASTPAYSQNHGHHEGLTEDQYQEHIDKYWTSSNTDNDDVLSVAELHTILAYYDLNNDGTITRHEYTTFLSAQTPELLSYAHALYDIYDADGDHHLGMQDLDKLYAKMDIDGDGTVSKTDFYNFWNQILHDLAHLHGHGHHLG
ncbi:uncharacterized protein LOC128156586 [Crassostrea angulata]|uniref:uncharacterized protein LOC128156586 n=1 Tax=Magallana angulata TaxID=2784310 RepID=UPI0022B1FAC0|nr:uncharacterized protein LOC128156586 [Crassostrea angulata]